MSVAESSSISSDGVRLLDCFVDGLDDVVYEMAEELAKKRAAGQTAPGEVARIEAEDIRSAGRIVLDHLRQLVREGKLPADLERALDDAERCFSTEGR